MLTSNRTRELHDALKRRCLYHWIDYPRPAREAEIVRARLPGVPDAVAARVCAAVARLRDEELYKLPGRGGDDHLGARAARARPGRPLDDTLGVALKVREDIERVRERGSARRCLTAAVGARSPRGSARLAARMRAAGAHVGVGELLAAHRALAAVDAASREDAYLALRAALCSSRRDLARLRGRLRRGLRAPRASRSPNPLEALGDGAQMALPRVSVPDDSAAARWTSTLGRPSRPRGARRSCCATRTSRAYTDAERAAARRLLARLARRGPTRLSRRTRRTRRRRDVPRPARHAARLAAPRRRAASSAAGATPTERPRRLVLVLDVSGSMAPYARMLLQYVQAAVAARARVEAFAFGTRLTRVTRELAGRDPDRALRARRRARRRLVGRHAHRRRARRRSTASTAAASAAARSSSLLSDGWDRGDPDELAAEMARLRRSAHRLVWLNPLAADPRYAPLTRGMQAAMPHVDRLLPGNSIASLEAAGRR